MYEKCTYCEQLGRECCRNLYAMNVEEIREWARLRLKHKGWTYTDLSEASGIPKGTISSYFSKKGGDINYSTFAPMLFALIGGEPGEYPCPNPPVDVTLLEQKIDQLSQENEELKNQANHAEAIHREDVRSTHAENQKTINQLKQNLQYSHDQLVLKDKQISQKDEVITNKDQRYADLEKRNRILIRAIFIILGLALGYLLFFDLPYPEYGILRFKEFVDSVKNIFSPGCGVITALLQVLQWIRY